MPWIQPTPQTYAKLVPTLERNIVRLLKQDIPFDIDMNALEDVMLTAPHHIRQFLDLRYIQKLSRPKLQDALHLEVAGLTFLEEQTINYLTRAEFVQHYVRTETSVAPSDNRILSVQNHMLLHTLNAIRDGRLTADQVQFEHITPRPAFNGPTLHYIEHLPLSTNAYHALHWNGVTSVEHIQSIGLEKLRTLRRLGARSVYEIKYVCLDADILVDDTPQDISFETVEPLQLPSIDDLETMINGVTNGYQDHIELPIYHDTQPGGTP